MEIFGRMGERDGEELSARGRGRERLGLRLRLRESATDRERVRRNDVEIIVRKREGARNSSFLQTEYRKRGKIPTEETKYTRNSSNYYKKSDFKLS